ncbi:MAG: hypothetical protein WD276_02110 [Actinomycetota bacterium]
MEWERVETTDQMCPNCHTKFPAADRTCPNCYHVMDAEFSRWKGGPTSFGPVTKVVLTSVAAVATFLSVWAGIGLWKGPFKFMLITRAGLLLVLIPVGAIALTWWIWKPQRVR